MIKYVVAVVLAVLALFTNFKAGFVAEKLLKKEPARELILKIKLVAAALAIIDFVFVMILI